MKGQKATLVVVVGFWESGMVVPSKGWPPNLQVASLKEAHTLSAIPGGVLVVRSSISDAEITSLRLRLKAAAVNKVKSLFELRYMINMYLLPKQLELVISTLTPRASGFSLRPELEWSVPNYGPIASGNRYADRFYKRLHPLGPWRGNKKKQ